ncbi:HIT family protein [Thioalkalivibrio sp. XN8]|uniref:HIT family protein n=1 Tax=Thioalkalivibrio sp. XN8 TaxID=2712863 RepID=UPI0013E9FD15|nr:HIT family protein [Thioalkalivibrio sp. XN8]NGP53138.1 HIT family protein [Thioalkalivibrio sp. XN8]
MAGFELHPRLQADCHSIGRFALSRVLLYRNASLPWLILVPEVHGEATELYELDAADRRMLDAEIDTLARYLKAAHGAKKVNVAAIGNLVPQLHVHVIGRRPDDPCWPGVVWGNLPPAADWGPDQLEAIATAIAGLSSRPGAARASSA